MHAVSLVPLAGALRAAVTGSAFTTGSGRLLLTQPATCSVLALVLREGHHPRRFVERRGRSVAGCIVPAAARSWSGFLCSCLPVRRLAAPCGWCG